MNSNHLLCGVLKALFHLTSLRKWTLLTLISPVSVGGKECTPLSAESIVYDIASLWVSVTGEDSPHLPWGATAFFPSQTRITLKSLMEPGPLEDQGHSPCQTQDSKHTASLNSLLCCWHHTKPPFSNEPLNHWKWIGETIKNPVLLPFFFSLWNK